jgi:cytochrome c biogenesis protein CcmG, thiol:disulfide interchange protein DsbE
MRTFNLERAIQTLIVLLLGVFVYVIFDSFHQRLVEVGDSAPDFSITTDSGRTVTAGSFGGKLLVLNFWASWCQPCLQEVPSLEVFNRQFAPEGVVVLGVSVDKNENLYHRFLQQFPVTFQVARDPSWDIAANYGTFQLPETYIIDSSGKVVQKVIAAQNWMNPEFVQSIKKML